MIKAIIALAALAVLTLIAALTFFLGPDDLSRCGQAPSNSSNCAAADAIVVVSGGDTNARVDAAIERYRNGWSPLLIFSGAAQDENGPSNAQAMKTRAVSQGVPSENVVIQRRASLEFGARLGRSVEIVNAPVTQDKQWSRWWWLTPHGWWLALGELVKIIIFFTSGGTS